MEKEKGGKTHNGKSKRPNSEAHIKKELYTIQDE